MEDRPMMGTGTRIKDEGRCPKKQGKLSILFSVDVEEYYHAENISNSISISQIRTLPSRVEMGTHKILDLLALYGGRATFFILGCIAKEHKDLIRRISAEGHEVASHGYDHIPLYKHTADSFKEDLGRSINVLEELTGKKVLGYRATSFSLSSDMEWFFDILRAFDIKYDSSVARSWFRKHLDLGQEKDGCFELSRGILEFPISYVRLGPLSMPLGGGYFRAYPFFFSKWGLQKASLQNDIPPLFYLHPWELDDSQPRFRLPLLKKIRHYLNINKAEDRLEKILKGSNAISIESLLVPLSDPFRGDHD